MCAVDGDFDSNRLLSCLTVAGASHTYYSRGTTSDCVYLTADLRFFVFSLLFFGTMLGFTRTDDGLTSRSHLVKSK
jgi:hypothetical protein